MCINRNEKLLPYYERIKGLLNYNPETGDLIRNKSTSNKAIVGDVAGTVHKSGYIFIKTTINGMPKGLPAHRIAWFMTYGELPNLIDHINCVRNDNRISNLRSCTPQQNVLNQGKTKNNTSGYRGVSWHKSNKKWQASIKFNKKSFYIGQFGCPKEASEAYEAKAKELHGEFYHV